MNSKFKSPPAHKPDTKNPSSTEKKNLILKKLFSNDKIKKSYVR